MDYTPKLIALHGLKGSGKDLTARIIQSYVLNSQTFAFATKLKQICATAWDVSLVNFNDETLKERIISGKDLSPRSMMTSMQGALKEAFGNDVFAKDLAPAWSKALSAGKTLIVTDLRFDVELEVCRNLGALVVHVQRDSNDLYTPSDHVSERGLPLEGRYKVLMNSGDQIYLLHQVRGLIEYVWGRDALRAYPFVPSDLSRFAQK